MRTALVLLLAVCSFAKQDEKPDNGPFLTPRSSRAPHCPKGFQPQPTEGPLGFRCVPERAGSLDRALRETPAELDTSAAQATGEYVPFRARGLKAEVPRGWAKTDAWSDEVPMIYIEQGQRRRGKPVALTISRLSPGQRDYEPMQDAIAKEKEYQGARETGARRIGGLQCREILVRGESRSAYADAGAGAYYVLTYSAPKELFTIYEPAYERLLLSVRFEPRR